MGTGGSSVLRGSVARAVVVDGEVVGDGEDGLGRAAVDLKGAEAEVAGELEGGAAEALARAPNSAGRAFAVTGPLVEGHAPRAPYDAILVLGGVETHLDALFAQLKPRGTLAAVETSTVHNGRRPGRVMLYRPTGGDVSGSPIFDATVPVLPEFQATAGFVF